MALSSKRATDLAPQSAKGLSLNNLYFEIGLNGAEFSVKK